MNKIKDIYIVAKFHSTYHKVSDWEQEFATFDELENSMKYNEAVFPRHISCEIIDDGGTGLHIGKFYKDGEWRRNE